ncbi:hypothetical protein BSKO_12432 [Bryopsis sp. KO-2023]|nr:hypothetical protein BSKO_12432 [Bryopsis sp. KO-2023]
MAFSTSFTKVQGLTASRPVVRRAPVRVRAQEVEAEKPIQAEDLPEFSFKSNTRSSIGYLEEDSAGQTNIFAVQPKQYVQGSSYDDTTGTDSNAVFGVGGAVLGLAVVGLGVTALTSLGGGDASVLAEDFSNLQTLSQYKAEFESSLTAPDVTK